ncbi:MAG: iron-sulfur cluster biosynthesis transcriptional regulator SufR [Coleofasciculaceae cyanobacterium RL_1_1]|nr:iron-sulfur cluster biosynthesis transcriptional regulator SufR [Coleofasciculaceae cyanobacterium RL_1_1]
MTAKSQTPSTKEDILQYLLKQGQARVQDLAERLSVSPQAIRRHLKDLEADDLIEYQSVQEGMGRPQHLYRLTTAGRSHFPHRYDEFAVSLLDSIADTVGRETVSEVLGKQWQAKALEYRRRVGLGSLRDRLRQLVEIRCSEGYMTELIEVEAEDEVEQFVIAEYNCAISSVAESYPMICGHELLMFATIFPDCQVDRTHWMIDGENRCGYSVQQQVQKSSRS